MFGALKKVGGLVRALKPIAPILAAGLEFAPWPAPVAKAALKKIAEAVGGDPDDPASVETALGNASSDDLVKLRQMAVRFEADLKKAQIDLEAKRIEDTQDARRSHRDSPVPAVLAFLLVGSFVAGLLVPIFLDGSDRDLVQNVIVGLGPLAGASVSYWMGSSRTSDRMAERGGAG